MNLTRDEIDALGFAHVGRDVRIHRNAEFYGAERIRIGDYSRIDSFSLLSAGDEGICIGKCVHVASGCYMFGGGGKITLEDYSGLSSRVSIYTATDDYTGGHMTNPTVPDEVRAVRQGPVSLHKHVIIGAHSVVLPGVEMQQGAAAGALTLVGQDVEEFAILVGKGHGTRVVGHRGKKLLEMEAICESLIAEREHRRAG